MKTLEEQRSEEVFDKAIEVFDKPIDDIQTRSSETFFNLVVKYPSMSAEEVVDFLDMRIGL